LVMSAAAAADPAWRKQCGGDAHVVTSLAHIMAEAAKDRSSDYLVSAGDHPSLVYAAEAMANASIEARLSVVSDSGLSVPHRACRRAIYLENDRSPKQRSPKYPVEFEKFQIEAEAEDMCAREPAD
jgi:hypothetical protein